jgi:hypothetical protein
MTETRWYRPKAACEYMGGISRRQLDVLRASGKLRPSYLCGPRSPRYDRLELDAAMLAARSSEGTVKTDEPVSATA